MCHTHTTTHSNWMQWQNLSVEVDCVYLDWRCAETKWEIWWLTFRCRLILRSRKAQSWRWAVVGLSKRGQICKARPLQPDQGYMCPTPPQEKMVTSYYMPCLQNHMEYGYFVSKIGQLDGFPQQRSCIGKMRNKVFMKRHCRPNFKGDEILHSLLKCLWPTSMDGRCYNSPNDFLRPIAKSRTSEGESDVTIPKNKNMLQKVVLHPNDYESNPFKPANLS